MWWRRLNGRRNKTDDQLKIFILLPLMIISSFDHLDFEACVLCDSVCFNELDTDPNCSLVIKSIKLLSAHNQSKSSLYSFYLTDKICWWIRYWNPSWIKIDMLVQASQEGQLVLFWQYSVRYQCKLNILGIWLLVYLNWNSLDVTLDSINLWRAILMFFWHLIPLTASIYWSNNSDRLTDNTIMIVAAVTFSNI